MLRRIPRFLPQRRFCHLVEHRRDPADKKRKKRILDPWKLRTLGSKQIRMNHNWPLIAGIALAIITIVLLLLGYGWASMIPAGIAVVGVVVWLWKSDFDDNIDL